MPPVRKTAATGNHTTAPTLERETALWSAGRQAVAGVDEAGRGPLAGPVSAGAVILPQGFQSGWLDGVRDSKLLTAARRRTLEAAILGSLDAAVGLASAAEIDALGIGVAVRLAMRRAVSGLRDAPDYLLVDGRERVELPIAQHWVIAGDALCVSIAAASIIAKEHRDRLMEALDVEHPGWGFAQHKGYPTAMHRERLAAWGPTPIHRRSYAPVAAALAAR